MRDSATATRRATGPRGLAFLLSFLLSAVPSAAQQQQSIDSDTPAEAGRPAPAPTAVAALRTGDITIDGRLDEATWQSATVATGFIQREPVEGTPAEADTEVRILFDGGALYIGARMHDGEPETIARQLVRRDEQGQYDYFEVALDPNLDRRTGYLFRVSAANVQGDDYLYDDSRRDNAWDAVWESDVQWDERGWTAEIRIPMSQIRYDATRGEQRWGVNFARKRIQTNEETHYALISKLQSGVVSQFAPLDGIRIDGSPRRIELRPYMLTSNHTGPTEEGDPFFDGSDAAGRAGVDLRYGLGSAFTVDATINPDFGQVEADPAVNQPLCLRDVLPGAAPVFRRGRARVRLLALGRSEQAVLQPSCRSRAAGEAVRRSQLHGSHHHPGGGEADRPHSGRPLGRSAGRADGA